MAKSTGKITVAEAIAAKCRILETELSFLNRSIKKHPNNDRSYYLKAAKLEELGELTGDERKYEEALASINRAIELDSGNLQCSAKIFLYKKRNSDDKCDTGCCANGG